MQVFNAYFKVIKKNLPSMLIYLGVFLVLSVLFSLFYTESSPTGFSESKSDIAFINEDKNSVLVEGMQDYLAQNANIIDIAQDEQSLQDALFYRKVVYIARVPEGFTESFLSGKNEVQIEKTTVPASASGVFMDMLIKRYLQLAELYSKTMPELTQEQLAAGIASDLTVKSDVVLKTFSKEAINQNSSLFFTYIAYTMMAIMILGVSSILMVFNEGDLKRRNLCSPLRSSSMNLQLLLGNLVFAVIVWACLVAISAVLRGSSEFNMQFVLLCVNAFALALACLSISFLVGNLIKSKGAQQSIANVLSLGTCFISGVFVPQYMLGATVKAIASFTPTYWYAKAVLDISNLTLINAQTVQPIVLSMLIQAGFAIALLAVALVIAKQKRISKA